MIDNDNETNNNKNKDSFSYMTDMNLLLATRQKKLNTFCVLIVFVYTIIPL